MPRSKACPGRDARLGRRFLCRVLFLAALAAGRVVLCAESGTLPSAPAGKVETGVPSFIVLGRESLGFTSAPTDLHLLPDGRILIVSQREIAIGDGVRWETFQEAADDRQFIYSQVAVDGDGRIYAGINGAIARIDFGEDARWRFVPVLSVAANDPYEHVVQFSDTWLWYSGGGDVLSWKPGQAVRVARLSLAVEHIFAVGSDIFASSGSSGRINQLHFGGGPTPVPLSNPVATNTVTSSAAFGPGRVLVGTVGDGIRVFDGKTLGPLQVAQSIGTRRRIRDVCEVGAGLYAAAVDMTGIVFFKQDGSTVQILGRALDHRLARVRRLVFSSKGVLWGLLDRGVLCVQFPSQLSDFEPLLSSVISYARPLRHDGILWILADGRLARAVYSEDGVLDRFEPDSPPGQFVWAVSEYQGKLFAGNEEGTYVRKKDGWQEIAAGAVDTRVGLGPPQPDGRIFYVGRDEIGWMRPTKDGYSVERIPVKGLGEVYNAVTDPGTSSVWLELGVDRVGRVDFGPGRPTVRFFGREDGLGDGWDSIFTLDGTVRFSTSVHLQLLDPATQRFVADEALSRRIPLLALTTGRPERDASGRLWFACEGSVHYVDDLREGDNPVVNSLPVGFEPTEFNMQPDGVVWMHGRGHLIRYDPGVPSLPTAPLQARITSVEYSASDRHMFNPGPSLPPLHFSDNSVVIRFAAPSDPFGLPVSFDVKLGGAADPWVGTGSVGTASYHRLKEGNYVFRVRPVIAGVPGGEADLAFTVLPPWFRTRLAWAIYALLVAGITLLGAWFFSYLDRREKSRLGHLVTKRTAELAASEERYRRLNSGLEARVAERTTELSRTNAVLTREIAERHQVEKALRENEALFRSLFENNHTIMLVIDPETGAIVDANPAAAAYYGWSREELIAKNVMAINTLSLAQVREELEAAREAPRACFNFRHRRADGSIHDVEVFSSPISVGGRTLLYSLVFDITERRRADERIRRLNRTLSVLSDIDQAIVRERDLVVLYREACRIAVEKGGFRLAWIGMIEAGGTKVIPVAHAGGSDEFFADLDIDLGDPARAAGPTGAALQSGHHSICNDIENDPRMAPWREAALRLGYGACGAFPLRVNGRIIGTLSLYSADSGFFDDEELTLLDELAMDISFAVEHAEAESGRRVAEERFRQAQKMEAVGQLAGGVAHDFNNLLTVIQGHCGLLLSGKGAADPETKESATEIQAAAIRAANLTRQLLTFSRRQPMQVHPIELDEVASSVGRMLQRLIGEDIVLHISLLAGGAWVEADPGMIEQVLLNLAVNARDAMPAGGDLWLGVEVVTLDESAAARHPAARPGNFVCLSLRDTGNGIAADHLPHIFEPFFTTKEVGKGTGLGLATVHGIVEQHHGWIEVESEAGRGSAFRVYLPRISGGAGPPAVQHDLSRVRGGHESILVVEDEEAVRTLVVKYLRAQGYHVQEASSGAAALELWREKGGAFDLVLTDLIMPGGVSGTQLAEKLRAGRPALKVIFMSGYRGSAAGDRVDANFLQKPFNPAHLASAIRVCLDS